MKVASNVFYENGDGTLSHSGKIMDLETGTCFETGIPPGVLAYGNAATIREHSSQNGYNFTVKPRPANLSYQKNSEMQYQQNGQMAKTQATQAVAPGMPGGIAKTLKITLNNTAGATAARIVIGDGSAQVARKLSIGAPPEGFVTSGTLGANSLNNLNRYLQTQSIGIQKMTQVASNADVYTLGETNLIRYDLAGDNLQNLPINWEFQSSAQDFNQTTKVAENLNMVFDPSFAMEVIVPAGRVLTITIGLVAVENARLFGSI